MQKYYVINVALEAEVEARKISAALGDPYLDMFEVIGYLDGEQVWCRSAGWLEESAIVLQDAPTLFAAIPAGSDVTLADCLKYVSNRTIVTYPLPTVNNEVPLPEVPEYVEPDQSLPPDAENNRFGPTGQR